MKNKKIIYLLILTAILFICPLVKAQTNEIEKITVIAKQKYMMPENTSAQMSIITSEEIKASGARNLGEILNNIAGTYVQNYGSLGSLSIISIRGSSSEQVLVLINGKRLNTAQGGGIDFSTINPENIDRIEVIRGGASAIYGENALGGVINIITKEGNHGSQVYISYAYGSYNTHIASINLQGSLDKENKHDYFCSFRGISSVGNYLFTDQKRSKTKKRQNTGLIAGDGDIKLGWNIGSKKDHRITLNFMYHQDDKGVPGMVDFPTVSANMQERRTISQLGYDHKNHPFFYKGSINIGVYTVLQKRNFKDPEYFLGKIDDWHDNRAWGMDFSSTGFIPGWVFQKIHFGYNYRWDWLNSTSLEKSPGIVKDGKLSREAHSLYVKDDLHFFRYKKGLNKLYGRIVLIPAVRWDINNAYENVASKQIGTMLNCDKKQRFIIKGNIGTAYRAPSFDDLFWPATAFAIGNPDLKPEKSINWDTGILTKLYRWLSAEIVYFQSEVTDLIQWNPGPGGQWRPKNIGKVLINGIETEIKAIWTLDFIKSYVETVYNYSLTYITDKTGQPATDGKQLPRRPYEKANFIMSLHSPEKYFIRWETHFVGFRYLTAHNTKYLPSYYTHNINTGIFILKNYEISLLIKNVLNHEYIDIREYPIPGQEIMLKFGVKF